MSDSRYRPRHGNRSAPRWFTNLIIVRPERRRDKAVLQKVVRGEIALDEVPELGKGNKPNADWDWD